MTPIISPLDDAAPSTSIRRYPPYQRCATQPRGWIKRWCIEHHDGENWQYCAVLPPSFCSWGVSMTHLGDRYFRGWRLEQVIARHAAPGLPADVSLEVQRHFDTCVQHSVTNGLPLPDQAASIAIAELLAIDWESEFDFLAPSEQLLHLWHTELIERAREGRIVFWWTPS